MTSPRPDQVDGYAEAGRRGRLPVVPPEPPRPVCPDSRRVSLLFVPVILGSLLVAIMVQNSLQRSGLAPLLLFGIVFVELVVAIVVPARLRMREYAAGYCRADDIVGLHYVDLRFQNLAGPAGAAWDLRGLWRLGPDGQVQRPPDRSVLPPGRYPSPTEPQRWDTWTGAEWLLRPVPVQRI